jgi:hypothetical protein
MVVTKMIKVGDLVATRCYGPGGTVGELGIIAAKSSRFAKTWWVLFDEEMQEISSAGIQVINENRRPSTIQKFN